MPCGGVLRVLTAGIIELAIAKLLMDGALLSTYDFKPDNITTA
ncbi:MAG: hypothetical protein ACI945_002267, partial [Pseudohongiellaceae bacterium]